MVINNLTFPLNLFYKLLLIGQVFEIRQINRSWSISNFSIFIEYPFRSFVSDLSDYFYKMRHFFFLEKVIISFVPSQE